MHIKQPTSNSHKTEEHRKGVKPNMSQMLSHNNSYNVELKNERYKARAYTPALSSKTLIYDQSRVIEPPNRYGHRFITYNDPTVRIRPAGMDGKNNTRATGNSFTYKKGVQYPQNVSFI